MTIRNKPKKDISDIIEKGGELSSISNDRPKWKTMPLRISIPLLEELNEDLKSRIGMSRNAWILEAIQEKLKKHNH